MITSILAYFVILEEGYFFTTSEKPLCGDEASPRAFHRRPFAALRVTYSVWFIVAGSLIYQSKNRAFSGALIIS